LTRELPGEHRQLFLWATRHLNHPRIELHADLVVPALRLRPIDPQEPLGNRCNPFCVRFEFGLMPLARLVHEKVMAL